MSSVIEAYNQVFRHIEEIRGRIAGAEEEIGKLSTKAEGDSSVRIAKLKEQIKKIDEYLPRVKAYQELAKRNMDSQNVLTIEAPPGYRVNLNRLRNWAMMISPFSDNDPYAQRVYLTAKCDECFLQKKRREFEDRIAQLTADQSNVNSDEIVALKNALATYREELRQYAASEEMMAFARCAVEANDLYWYRTAPEQFINRAEASRLISPGAYAAPLPVDQEQRSFLKGLMGDCYNAEDGRVRIPVEIGRDREYVMTVNCAPSLRKRLDKALQNLILETLNESPAGTQRVYVLDGVRYSSACLGSLRELEDSFVVAKIPRNPDQMTETLEQMVSDFADIDEVLDTYDSVNEYNADDGNARKLPLSTVIILGWPRAFEGRNRELLRKVLTNYERFGASVVAITYQGSTGNGNSIEAAMPEYAAQNAIRIEMSRKESTIAIGDAAPQLFKWYLFGDTISTDYAKSRLKYETDDSGLGCEYIKRVDMQDAPNYTRGKKSISLPYGVDSKDRIHSVSFDNENFAAYLMGASGSGKSTLLHTLITGILREYHPDDVELWLADFKMSEFAQYIDPMPPHIRYILLDESPELVYDLIDRLTEKMMERQRFFMQHRDLKKVENVPGSTYMPVIFVILDEFSIMSQAVSESEPYKLKLQNLLAKGRALGIKFIFSSQTFTKGVAGLTQTAKDQIQTRIAMKNSYEEINETLELSSAVRTEQVKNWMDAMPPHFTLMKYRDGDELQVKRVQVMYFKGEGDAALEPQRNLIHRLNAMRPVSESEYDSAVLDAYVDKRPIVVDGNSYSAFNPRSLMDSIEEYKRGNSDSLSEDSLVFSFGTPRRMVSAMFSALSGESRENLLLIARGTEQPCAMSVILTAMKTARLQGAEVHVWANSKNRLYRTYKDSHLRDYTVAEGMGEICAAIRDLKSQIAEKKSKNELIVLLGMEQICGDFELIDFGAGASYGAVGAVPMDTAALMAVTEEDRARLSEVTDMQKKFEEMYDLEQMEDEWLEAGRALEDIASEEERLFKAFLDRMGESSVAESAAKRSTANTHATAGKADAPTAADVSYNAMEDFKYIVRQGSRFGYHFMLCLNDLADLKETRLQQELFRHKLVFQISAEDSAALFASKAASRLPEHICQYSDSLEQYSFRPFIHEGVTWDGWVIDNDGSAVNSAVL